MFGENVRELFDPKSSVEWFQRDSNILTPDASATPLPYFDTLARKFDVISIHEKDPSFMGYCIKFCSRWIEEHSLVTLARMVCLPVLVDQLCLSHRFMAYPIMTQVFKSLAFHLMLRLGGFWATPPGGFAPYPVTFVSAPNEAMTDEQHGFGLVFPRIETTYTD